jgi:Tfp pilus assembly protein PilF
MLAAAAVIAPLPAFAGVTVLGTSHARVCYQAAEANSPPRAEDFAACDEALLSAATLPKEIVATHVNRGILRLRRGHVDQAMADFDRAMALDPSEPETYLNRGSALMRRDDAANALTMFSEAIQRNTRRPELAYYGRAMANELSGNVRAAYQDYRRASELAPRWRDPRIELRRFTVTRN